MPFGTDVRLLTDGTRLYFLEGGTSGIQITQVALTGGETAPVGPPSGFLAPVDISPTNPDLLVAGGPINGVPSALGVMSVTGGAIKPLSGTAGLDGAFSPDGKRIVYVTWHDLYVAASDGSNSKKLLTVKGYLGEPRFSPDASRLRFTVRDAPLRRGGIWEASADGTNLHPVLPAWEKDGPATCCGYWTIDGKYFIFLSYRAQRTELWAIREKQLLFERVNTEPVQLTAGTLHLTGFVPGRDGKHIYVVGIQNKGELERYDSKSKQFLPYLSGMDVPGVDISKDGQWVTYVDPSERRLWRRKTDGSGEMALTSSPMQADTPRWSPDGTQIAFAARTAKNQWHVFVTRREAGFPEQLTTGNCDEGDPSWSPDGNHLVFACTSGDPGAPIHMIDLKTNQVTDLQDSNWFISPIWSPDGRYIAALSADSNELKLFDLRSGRWESSIPIQRGEYSTNPSPNWSSDGSYIYFRSHEAGAHGLSRVRINNRNVERILSFGNLRRYSSWMGLDPSDAPLVVAEKGTQEIYALDVDWP